MANTYPHILLIEDDDVDAEAMIRAFKQHRVSSPVTHVVDGIEALATLRDNQAKQPLSYPHIILLDLNLPRMNGIEFLKVIRQDEALKNSIVFVITTSNFDGDKLAAYTYNVAGYVLKDNAEDGFLQIIDLLDHYQSVVELPI